MAARRLVCRMLAARVVTPMFWLLREMPMGVGLSASLDVSRRVFRQPRNEVLRTSDSESDSAGSVDMTSCDDSERRGTRSPVVVPQNSEVSACSRTRGDLLTMRQKEHQNQRHQERVTVKQSRLNHLAKWRQRHRQAGILAQSLSPGLMVFMLVTNVP